LTLTFEDDLTGGVCYCMELKHAVQAKVSLNAWKLLNCGFGDEWRG